MRVVIVTPSLNSAATLPATIESVLRQAYPQLVYWVQDGGSSDGTQALLASYGARLGWHSVPDGGQAEAINAALAAQAGDVFAWLNADDCLRPGALHAVVAYFQQHPEAEFVYGDALAIGLRGRSYGRRTHIQAATPALLLHTGNPIVQPAAFWRASLWRRLGGLDARWRYVFDYDFWWRAAQQTALHYLPVLLAEERLHAQTRTAQGGLARIHELEAWGRANGGAGVPRWYQPEAAAQHLLAALHGRNIKQNVAQVWRYRRAAPKIAAYVVAELWQPGGAMQLRLWTNQWRAWQGG